ncbi:UPF0587 protein CG4646 [Diabrotica virgifera virgifera]|uniref:Uncharacterized protein n=1 Tax=Diabrotica virgifera virgifera TaxID=50390 RepID=A0ABM5KQW2_DIAVI|nr:UPF0587 protein CG4646 [Diabrotica virgifera virgifera]
MGKLSLQIKATLEGLEELYTNHPDYNFLLKLKCTSCGEESNKWHDVSEAVTFPGKTGKSENNYIAKCKLCSRENCLDIVPGSNGKYTNEDSGKFKTIVSFECRGIEPFEFAPSEGWIAKVEESNKIFDNINLTEKEWVEYDEKSQQSVGVYEFESKFVPCK